MYIYVSKVESQVHAVSKPHFYLAITRTFKWSIISHFVDAYAIILCILIAMVCLDITHKVKMMVMIKSPFFWSSAF